VSWLLPWLLAFVTAFAMAFVMAFVVAMAWDKSHDKKPAWWSLERSWSGGAGWSLEGAWSGGAGWRVLGAWTLDGALSFVSLELCVELWWSLLASSLLELGGAWSLVELGAWWSLELGAWWCCLELAGVAWSLVGGGGVCCFGACGAWWSLLVGACSLKHCSWVVTRSLCHMEVLKLASRLLQMNSVHVDALLTSLKLGLVFVVVLLLLFVFSQTKKSQI
jgi:hypothetical protein